jgi:hypothetical protein
MPRPAGLAVASAVLAHAAVLLAWSVTGPASAPADPAVHLSVRLIEPTPAQPEVVSPPAPAIEHAEAAEAAEPAATRSVDEPHASAAAAAVTETPAVKGIDHSGEPWARPDRVVVRMAPSELASGPSQTVLSVSLDDQGRVAEMESLGAPLPAAFEEALRLVFAETRFRYAEADAPPTPRLRLLARFESSQPQR